MRLKISQADAAPFRGASLVVMTEAAEHLLEQAMSLSPEERLRVARELLSSVVDLEEAEWERAWLAELDERLARTRASEEPALSWQQVQERLRSLAPP